MKKAFGIVFVTLGLLGCFGLFLCFVLLGPSAAGANEVQRQLPRLMTEEGWNDGYLQGLSDYFSDHFHFRQEMIDAYAHLNAALFGVSSNEQVLLGADGWLYYSATLADHLGTEPMTEYELCAAADNLQLMQAYCDGQGMAFAFAPVPNKNTLYPEKMPDYGVRAPEHDLSRLTEKLQAASVNTVDLLRAFSEQDEVLYYAHDSHWNGRGAALGADRINAALGKESRFFAGEFRTGEGHPGDLYQMLYPASSDPEPALVYAGELAFTHSGKGAVRPDSITIRTTSDGEGSLSAFRDSFGNDLYPYLAASFGKASFSRSVNYNLYLASASGADAVLIELVERNLDYLIENLPVMPAPGCELELPAYSGQIALAGESAEGTLTGYTRWSGRQTEADDASPVWLLTERGAFPCFRLKDGAFSAYLPEDETVTGAAYYQAGQLCALSIEKGSERE